MTKDKWIWMGHPGHFSCRHECRFFLCTYVGEYIVSTIGEWLPNETTMEILAKNKGIKLKGIGDERLYHFINLVGYSELSPGRKYETMVFKAKKQKQICCPYIISDGAELETIRCNDAGTATKNHLQLCEKWSKFDEDKT